MGPFVAGFLSPLPVASSWMYYHLEFVLPQIRRCTTTSCRSPLGTASSIFGSASCNCPDMSRSATASHCSIDPGCSRHRRCGRTLVLTQIIRNMKSVEKRKKEKKIRNGIKSLIVFRIRTRTIIIITQLMLRERISKLNWIQ